LRRRFRESGTDSLAGKYGIARPGCRGGGGFTSVRCRVHTVVDEHELRVALSPD